MIQMAENGDFHSHETKYHYSSTVDLTFENWICLQYALKAIQIL